MCALNDQVCWCVLYVRVGEVVGRLLRFINIFGRAMRPNVTGGDVKKK